MYKLLEKFRSVWLKIYYCCVSSFIHAFYMVFSHLVIALKYRRWQLTVQNEKFFMESLTKQSSEVELLNISEENLSSWEEKIQYNKASNMMKTIAYIKDNKLLLEFDNIKKNIKYFLFFYIEDMQQDNFFFLYSFNGLFFLGNISNNNFEVQLEHFFEFEDNNILELISNNIKEDIERQLNIFVYEENSSYIVFKNRADENHSCNNLLPCQAYILENNNNDVEGKVFSNKDHKIIITDKKFCKIDFHEYPNSMVIQRSCVIIIDYSDNESYKNDSGIKETSLVKYKEKIVEIKNILYNTDISFYIHGKKDKTNIYFQGKTGKEKIREIFESQEYNFIFLCAHNENTHIALAHYDSKKSPTQAPDNYINVEKDLPANLNYIEIIELFECYSIKVATIPFLRKGVGVCSGNLGKDNAIEAIDFLKKKIEVLYPKLYFK